MISYRTGNDLDLDAVIDLYRDSTLGERRPVDDRERMEAMLTQSGYFGGSSGWVSTQTRASLTA